MNDLLHFLVTESALGARIVIRSHIMQLGHSVDMAADAESTLALVELKMYHLILLDAEFKNGCDCYELIDLIRKKSTYNERTPIILLSSSPHKIYKHSLYPYFAKPMNLHDVNKIINYLGEYNKKK